MEGFGFIQYDNPADAKDIVPSTARYTTSNIDGSR